MKNYKKEGFWRSKQEKDLPRPRPREKSWVGRVVFLQKLRETEGKLKCTYYRGMSVCRICHKSNGNGEYTHKGWVWPEGLRHYVEDHYVRPSTEFQEMILERPIEEV